MINETKSLSRVQWMTLAAAFLGWLFDGMEMGLFPIVARPALQDLLKTTAGGGDAAVGPWIGYITACFLIGAACGGLVFGWLGDKIGRVRAMTLSILTYSLFTGFNYFAQAPWHLGAFRFIAALGMGGEWSLGVALVMECWPEKLRPRMAGIIGASANVGYLLMAVIGMSFSLTRDSWRWVMLVGAGPAFLSLFVIYFVPESERWRAAVKETGTHPIVEIFSPRLLKKTLFGILFASIPLIGTWAAVTGWLPTWADQLTDGKNPGAKSWTLFWTSVGAIIGCYVAPVVGGHLGRRPVYFGLCFLSLGVCAWVFRYLDEYNSLFLLGATCAGLTTAAFYGWLPLYLPELFPTRARATGQGLCFNFGRVLAAAGALQMGQLVKMLGGSYAKAGATVTLVYALGMVVIWFAPETKGKPLPD